MRRAILLVLGCALAACTPPGNRLPANDVVMLVRLDVEDNQLPPALSDTAPRYRWRSVDVSAPGLAGAFSFFTPAALHSPLAPDPRNAPPPRGWTRRWLRWPVEIARTPEELQWSPSRWRDLGPTGNNLHLAVFEGADFDSSGAAWLDRLPAKLLPPRARWIVVDLPRSAQTPRALFHPTEDQPTWPVATVSWLGNWTHTNDVDDPVASTAIARLLELPPEELSPASITATDLPRFFRWSDARGGGIAWNRGSQIRIGRTNTIFQQSGGDQASAEAGFWAETIGSPLDLWVYVRGQLKMEFVEIELQIPEGVVSRRGLRLEDIDHLVEGTMGVERMQLGVAGDGDGAVYELQGRCPSLLVSAIGSLPGVGTLGIPFYAGPTGSSLGAGTVSLPALSRNFYRISSPEPPHEEQLSNLPVGVHLWLVPRATP